MMHYYQFNIGDYISHTAHLTDTEDLTYRRMLDLYYQTELPFDEVNKEKIARKVKSTIEIVQIILSEFFEYSVEDYSWHSKRADSEIKAYQSKADSARKANQIRWGSVTDNGSDLKSDAVQIPNNKQETINKKQETIKDLRPEDVEISVWEDFVKHRKAKNAVITERVIKKIRSEAGKVGMTLQAAFEHMCVSGWVGFDATWFKDKPVAAKPVGKVLKYWEKGYVA